MRRMIVLALLMAFVMPAAASHVFAVETTGHAAVVDAGNKLCPISGEPVAGTSFATYNGKRYGLCCPGCEKEFLANPEKYLAKMNAQEGSHQEHQAKMNSQEESHQEHHHGM